ncbi:MAG: RNA methyltransferase [Bacteroidales bacterium]|nr:RNA methyltransferase [Bacteroidales bacterium]
MEPDHKVRLALIEQMDKLITPRRRLLFDKVLANRTRHITIALENIFQPHNASAVLRSCDLTGVQDVHIIENTNEYNVNPDVAMGASKWLNLHKYNSIDYNTPLAYQYLRDQGYKIVATTPHHESITIDELPITEKVALVFGTELTGLTEWAISNADMYVNIPMVGFTESYNISVSAAICLYSLTRRLRASEISWKLEEEQVSAIRLQWLRNSIKKSEHIEKELLKNILSEKKPD